MATTRKTVRKARKLRRTMSKPEVILWQYLRKRPMGIKFRRQHPVGPYVLDFYCPTVKLTIEIDGMAHDMGNHPAQDEQRDLFLSGQGIAVIRIPSQDVLHEVEGVADQIVQHIQGLRQRPSTSLWLVRSPCLRHREDIGCFSSLLWSNGEVACAAGRRGH